MTGAGVASSTTARIERLAGVALAASAGIAQTGRVETRQVGTARLENVPEIPADVKLLTEIRDLMKTGRTL